MPIIIAALIGGISSALGSLVGRVLVSLGIGFVTYQGLDTAASYVKTQVLSTLSGLPAELYVYVALLQVPAIINVYFSAWMTGLVVSGLSGGSITRRVQKVPGG